MISCIDPRNHATIGPGHQPTDPPQFYIILESNQGSRCRDDDRIIPEMIHKNHFLGELLDCTFNGFTASPILAIKKNDREICCTATQVLSGRKSLSKRRLKKHKAHVEALKFDALASS